MQQFHAHGSLLLSGEYTLLHGAKALAIPTGKGQTLDLQASDSKAIKWLAKNHLDEVIFHGNLLCEQVDLSFIDQLIQALSGQRQTPCHQLMLPPLWILTHHGVGVLLLP